MQPVVIIIRRHAFGEFKRYNCEFSSIAPSKKSLANAVSD